MNMTAKRRQIETEAPDVPAKRRKLDTEGLLVQPVFTEQYYFIEYNNKLVCLICEDILRGKKKGSILRHCKKDSHHGYMTRQIHKDIIITNRFLFYTKKLLELNRSSNASFPCATEVQKIKAELRQVTSLFVPGSVPIHIKPESQDAKSHTKHKKPIHIILEQQEATRQIKHEKPIHIKLEKQEVTSQIKHEKPIHIKREQPELTSQNGVKKPIHIKHEKQELTSQNELEKPIQVKAEPLEVTSQIEADENAININTESCEVTRMSGLEASIDGYLLIMDNILKKLDLHDWVEYRRKSVDLTDSFKIKALEQIRSINEIVNKEKEVKRQSGIQAPSEIKAETDVLTNTTGLEESIEELLLVLKNQLKQLDPKDWIAYCHQSFSLTGHYLTITLERELKKLRAVAEK